MSTQRSVGIGEMSSARRLSAGSSGVLDGSSLRALPRSQPPCTNVSLPSGLTSLIVAWKSTFGLFVRTNSFTLPAPTTVVFELSGAVTYETALPAGFCVQLYGGVAVQRPLVPPAVSPVKSVSGRLKAFHVNASAPDCVGAALLSVPFEPRYHCFMVVPGIGNFENDFSNPGCGWPGCAPPAPLSNSTRIGGWVLKANSAAE